MDLRNADASGSLEAFQNEILTELEQSKRALGEVSLMLEQSQAEITKLTQRNAAITGRIQQIQEQLDATPRSDIRMTYNAALDAQQRLLVMRSQMEKLQGDQTHFKRMIHILEEAQNFFSGEAGTSISRRDNRSQTAILEMVIDAQETERQKLSRQMHDGPAQALSNFILQVDIATRLFEIDPIRAKEELNNLKSSVSVTFQKIRDFIFNLRPMMLDDLGLFPTIDRYVKSISDQFNVEVNLAVSGQQRRLESYLEVMIFRAIQEMTGNAIHHNYDNIAKLKIKVQLSIDDRFIRVTVSDNGKGFHPESAESTGIGLKLIRERVEILGGTFEIDSAIGQGSKVSFQIPCIEASSGA